MHSKLAISIPTYNRSEIIKFNIDQILEDLIKYNIPVYISDDSTDNYTELLIEELKSKHKLFFYQKNANRLGHDLNCLHSITRPSEKYVWYLGDSMIIEAGAIRRVLDSIDLEDFDFISCNAKGRNLNIESKIFTDKIQLFESLCWHLTLTGSTIYNLERLGSLADFDVTKFKNFPQTAIIFQQFAKKNAKLCWINESLVYNNPNKVSYWANNVFKVFLDDFSSFVHNLSNKYPVNLKDKVILNHSINTGVFNYLSFMYYRINGYFNLKTILVYKSKFKKFTATNIYILIGIALFPKALLKIAYNRYAAKPL